MKVGVRVDGMMLLTGLALLAGVYAVVKVRQVVAAIGEIPEGVSDAVNHDHGEQNRWCKLRKEC